MRNRTSSNTSFSSFPRLSCWRTMTAEMYMKISWLFFFSFIHIFHTFLDYCIFLHSRLRKWICTCKQNVGAKMSTMISISNGLGPSIFYQNMNWMLCMRENLDGKGFSSRQRRHSCFNVVITKVFSPISTFTSCVNNYASGQGRDKNRRTESTK